MGSHEPSGYSPPGYNVEWPRPTIHSKYFLYLGNHAGVIFLRLITLVGTRWENYTRTIQTIKRKLRRVIRRGTDLYRRKFDPPAIGFKIAYKEVFDPSIQLPHWPSKAMYMILFASRLLDVDRYLLRVLVGPEFLIKEYLAANKLNDALKMVQAELRDYPHNAFLLAANACLLRRKNGWQDSLPIWRALQWELERNPSSASKIRRNIIPCAAPTRAFQQVSLEPGATPRGYRLAVYASLFGDYDNLQPVKNASNNIDFLCFTDQDIDAEGWKIIKCEPNFQSSNLSAKEYKVLPHIHLADYDASLFIDASTWIYDDIADLINRFLLSEKFAVFSHPQRNCVFHEGEAVLSRPGADIQSIVEQLDKYETEGLPEASGLVEASFIWRFHNALHGGPMWSKYFD